MTVIFFWEAKALRAPFMRSEDGEARPWVMIPFGSTDPMLRLSSLIFYSCEALETLMFGKAATGDPFIEDLVVGMTVLVTLALGLYSRVM